MKLNKLINIYSHAWWILSVILEFWRLIAGASAIEGQPQLHSNFEGSLGYIRPYLKKTKATKKKI